MKKKKPADKLWTAHVMKVIGSLLTEYFNLIPFEPFVPIPLVRTVTINIS